MGLLGRNIFVTLQKEEIFAQGLNIKAKHMIDPFYSRTEETICALASSAQGAAIAVIRISGSEAFDSVGKIFKAKKQSIKLSDRIREAIYGYIFDGDELLDDVLLIAFRGPNSYTGEDSVEIQCHASYYIVQKVLHLLCKNGCKMAAPGEFTRRAWLNGKMDLSQAEAVADIIGSENKAQHRMAMMQLRGKYSEVLDNLRERMLHFATLLELELDFSEEDVEFASRHSLIELSKEIKTKISSLVASYQTGNAIKRGIPVAIVGAPNVGKSSLLNTLLGDNLAIVSDIPGTTRDSIEDSIDINGLRFRFIDTAGIRSTKDQIEALGIARSYEKAKHAQIVLLVIDAVDPQSSLDQSILEAIGESEKLFALINKTDLVDEKQLDALSQTLSERLPQATELRVSLKKGIGIEQLTDALSNTLLMPGEDEATIIVSNARHQQLLSEAAETISKLEEGLEDGVTADFLSLDLRHTIQLLGEITGNEISSQEVLHNIFANFCIGK